MRPVHNLSLLFAMLRSFSSLARTLNLSKAVRELGITRQTMHRHIHTLEECQGRKLFLVQDNQYHLTDDGRDCLKEAEHLLTRGEAWLNGEIRQTEGLLCIENSTSHEQPYFLQQHPLSRLWTHSSPFLRQCFKIWAETEGRIEDETFQPVRDYSMLYRYRKGDWICVDVGEKSSYAAWFGWTWEKSSIGYSISDLPSGTRFSNLVLLPFENILEAGGARLDHVYTQVSREPDGPAIPVSYQRLCLGGRFPDDSFALISIIDRTRNISIKGFSSDRFPPMPVELEMDGTPIS
ncbi:MAG: LysR family transcriptional regulator [Pseudomonadota bacterium]